MAVRAINVPVAKSAAPVAAAPAVDHAVSIFDRHCAAVIAALLDNNRGEAARAFARARHRNVCLTSIQQRAFDAGVSGALLRQAFTLSKDITPDALLAADAAATALQAGADKARIEAAKAKREAANNAPLTVKAFAGLKLG